MGCDHRGTKGRQRHEADGEAHEDGSAADKPFHVLLLLHHGPSLTRTHALAPAKRQGQRRHGDSAFRSFCYRAETNRDSCAMEGPHANLLSVATAYTFGTRSARRTS